MIRNCGNESVKYQFWLSNIDGIGAVTIKKLMQHVNSAEELYCLPDSQMAALTCISEKDRQKIRQNKTWWDVDGAWERFLKKDIRFLSQEMETFPERLRNIDSAPYGIYIKGSLPANTERSVAIVGARRCSEYGKTMAEKLGKALAEHGISVISGMARGVDSYAHIGSLKGKGTTYAVLGCGVDICYPTENKALYEDILQSGGIISEYPPGTEPRAQLFPARNRIISALCDIIVIVEAKERSGSLITADFAMEQGKDVFTCPGRATDALSFGCNSLIRQGAGIVTSVDAFLEDIGVFDQNKYTQMSIFENFANLSLEKDECMVYSCLDLRPRSMEELLRRTGIGANQLTDIICRLMGKGIIKETFRNYYIKADKTS